MKGAMENWVTAPTFPLEPPSHVFKGFNHRQDERILG